MSSRVRDKHKAFMRIAHDLAQLGTCDRAQVGAIIVRDGRCVSWGYNGAPPGMPHCDENHHGWVGTATPIADLDRVVEDLGCRNSIHAEANALAFAARQGISTAGATVYVTLAPCLVCAQLLIAAGIVEVRWAKSYRDESGANLLRSASLMTVPSARDCR